MRYISFLFFYLSFIVSAKKLRYIGSESSSEESYPSVSSVLDLRGNVRKLFALEAALVDHARNMICSPLSVLMPLGKLALGAEKKSEKELLAAIGLRSRGQIKSAFAQLITNMEYLPGVTLDVASRIFINTQMDINRNYVRRTKAIFKSTCQKIHPDNPTKVAQSINDWVSEKTRRKIRNLVSPSDISKSTSLILVNAIYFAGTWKHQFGVPYTDDFHSSTGVKRIPMMTVETRFNYRQCDILNAQLVELPYEGEQSSMIIVLPFSNSGLPVLLRALKLAPELLNQSLEKMRTQDVIVTIPKFKIETELNLNNLYKKIGLQTIFDKKTTDLTGMIHKDRVFVSKAIHKAIIEVNERGTEAAAASGAVAHPISYDPHKSLKFTANRPFLFVITAYQEQLFSGIFNARHNLYKA